MALASAGEELWVWVRRIRQGVARKIRRDDNQILQGESRLKIVDGALHCPVGAAFRLQRAFVTRDVVVFYPFSRVGKFMF